MVRRFNGYSCDDLELAWQRLSVEERAVLAEANLFLTGGTGFIGQWLVALLLWGNRTRGHATGMTILTRDPDRFRRTAPELADDPAVTLWPGDVRFFDFPRGRFSHLIHGATDTSSAADDDALTLADTIVAGTRRVLEFAALAGVRRHLFLSSGAVYGPAPAGMERFPEEYVGGCDPCDPRAAYGQSKRFAEQLCTLFQQRHGVESVIARCFAFVGPGLPLDAHFAVGNFIADALAGRPIRLTGDGTPTRSYLYAADLVVWLLRLLLRGRVGHPYNVGSGEGLPLAEVAQRVLAALGCAAPVAVLGRPDHKRMRSRYVPDVSRAERELGLTAWTSLEEGVRRTAAWAELMAAKAAGADCAVAVAAEPPRPRTFVFDVDGVVATITPVGAYDRAQPLTHTIALINRLYAAGHRIIMFTARGSLTGVDWRPVTEAQFRAWGLNYHELRMGKPAGDHYVDDRMVSLSQLHQLVAALVP